jgi:hypothetical protein
MHQRSIGKYPVILEASLAEAFAPKGCAPQPINAPSYIDMTEYQKLLSEAELSRCLNVSPITLRKMLRLGKLKPDYVAGRSKLFSLSRLSEIMALFKTHALS